jgi:hypothetical protein
MAEYKGASSEGQRQAMLEKQRAKMLSDFEKQREKITKVLSSFDLRLSEVLFVGFGCSSSH